MNLFTIYDNLKELFILIDGIRIQVDDLRSDFKNFSSDIEDIRAIVANRQRTFCVRFEDQSSIKIMATDIDTARATSIAKYRLSIDSIHELPDRVTPPTFW